MNSAEILGLLANEHDPPFRLQTASELRAWMRQPRGPERFSSACPLPGVGTPGDAPRRPRRCGREQDARNGGRVSRSAPATIARSNTTWAMRWSWAIVCPGRWWWSVQRL